MYMTSHDTSYLCPIGSDVIVEATDSTREIRNFTYRDFAIATGDLLDDVDDVDPTPPLRRHKRRRATSSDDDNPEVLPNMVSTSRQQKIYPWPCCIRSPLRQPRTNPMRRWQTLPTMNRVQDSLQLASRTVGINTVQALRILQSQLAAALQSVHQR